MPWACAHERIWAFDPVDDAAAWLSAALRAERTTGLGGALRVDCRRLLVALLEVRVEFDFAPRRRGVPDAPAAALPVAGSMVSPKESSSTTTRRTPNRAPRAATAA